MIPESTREAVLSAMDRFDRELRGTETWSGWEQNQAHKYAIEWEGRHYPVKEIVSLATRAPVSSFSGGDEANKYATKMGFSVVPFRHEGAQLKSGPGAISEGFEAILRDYGKARSGERFGSTHPVWREFETLQKLLATSAPVTTRPTVKVIWGAGKGNWAQIPWVSFLDKRETDTTQEGVYCVFLFRSDLSGVYLTFNQGVTEPKKLLGSAEGLKQLRSQAQHLRKFCGVLPQYGFRLDDLIDLRVTGGLGSDYMAGTVAYKLYETGQVPNDREILEDLGAMLNSYDAYLTSKKNSTITATPSSWIFQANPKIFNLSAALAELNEMTWLVRQHSEEIRAGDTVFLWESGEKAGIVAVAKVLTDPTPLPEGEEEKKFTLQHEKFEGDQLRVRLRIERRLAHPILRQTLLQHATLDSLAILVAPQGTNFAVSPEQAEALNALLRSGGGMEPTRIQRVIEYIAGRGFVFEPWQIAAYITALRTKPFVILAGVSGTGKSKLPALVAQATGGNSQLIAVRPDWTDSSEVLGYSDLAGRFRPGSLLEAARTASDQPDKHFVCIVDEMNLAHVEHYFAEVLSRIEDRKASVDGGFHSSALLGQTLGEADAKWSSVFLPPNLAIVGTVNMDESAHGFSRKVLDRAFTLEFSEVNLLSWKPNPAGVIPAAWPASAWYPRALQLSGISSLVNDERQLVDEAIAELIEANKILTQAQLQVGYRTRDEICLFALHAHQIAESFTTTEGETVNPLDLAFHMKILPRIAGGSGAIRRTVLHLLGWANTGSKLETEEQARGIVDAWRVAGCRESLAEARYPRTAARLCLMWDRILNEGFTSFWL